MIETLRQELLSSRSPDGGWGTYPGGPTNVEATAFALMGLAAALPDPDETGLESLLALQTPAGAWPMLEGMPESPPATALAMLALSTVGAEATPVERATAWLADQSGTGAGWAKRAIQRWLPELLPVQSRLDLRGWPWVAGTWSWVEPTAYAVAALKRARHDGHVGEGVDERILEGERMLRDRMCHGGGWNYGNKKVLGEALLPYPDETALALLALDDASGDSAIVASLRVLELLSARTPSGLTSALAAICLSRYGRDPSRARDRLRQSHAHTGFLGDNKVRGLALLALEDAQRWLEPRT